MPVTEKAAASAKKKHVKVKGRLPSKRSINLATVGLKKTHWVLVLPATILLVALAAAFSKFLVYDRMQTVYAAQAEARAVQEQIDEGYAEIRSYGELNDVYAHYTYSGFTEEERTRVSRVAAMDLLERVVLPRTEVREWTINGNELTLSLEGGTLQEVNETVQALLADDLVSFCNITDASTRIDSIPAPEGSEEEVRLVPVVTANVEIYLQAEEVAAP